jgi:pyruvate dehydrogenase E2 component (dihydrolipoamide acetyltransferase)
MAEVIKMPRMSDTMTEGVIVSWVKKEGDQVKSGDVLAEVETDKATMELESYTDGVLLHIGAQEGKAVPVDGIIAVIGKQGEDWNAALGGAQPAPETPKQAAAETQPKEQPQTSQQPEAAKTEQKAVPEKAKAAEAEGKANTTNDQATITEGRVIASPLAKKIAEEKGLNLGQVPGSGDNGRIVKRDVENYKPEAAQNGSKQQAQKGSYEDVPVSQMRKAIARRLAESKFSAPHFYLTTSVNMDAAIAYRKKINDFLGEKISFNDIVIKAVSAALKRHPKVNASWLGDKIRYYNYVNIGVAIAVEDGLVVPVVRNADQKGMLQINREVKEFAAKAKNKKLQPNDFEGNTFTISNLGMFGIDEFTAIINPPDACILAVGRIAEVPVVVNGEIKVGNIMKLTLSCDHRVVDGASGAQYLQTLKQFLEEPVIILA